MLTSSHGPARRMINASRIEAPFIATIEPQVRTAASIPFQSYMRGHDLDDAPSVETVGLQVRTAASVPFQSYMRPDPTEAPAVDTIGLQVRTAASVPFASYMSAGDAPTAETVEPQVRTAASVPFNPYMLGAHAEELLKKRVMISPVLTVWTFSVANEERFLGWLGTREILLSEARLGSDTDVRGVRYGGTYRVESTGTSTTYKVVWGFTSESARTTFDRLTSSDCASASLVQLDVIDFVKGLRGLAKQTATEVMVSAAARQA